PFDFATFAILSEQADHAKTTVMWPPPEWEWTTAWFAVGSAPEDFVKRKETWGPDLEAEIRRTTPNLLKDKVVHNLINQEQVQGYISVPVIGNGTMRASMTLLSKKSDRYGEEDWKLLQELGVDRALLNAEAAITRRRAARMNELTSNLLAAPDYRSLAST